MPTALLSCFQMGKRLQLRSLSVFIYQYKNLSMCHPKLAKRYLEKENEYALSVLKKSPIYQRITKNGTEIGCKTMPSVIDSKSLESNDSFRKFITLTSDAQGKYVTVEDPVFDGIIKTLITEIPKLCDEQIIAILSALSQRPPTESTRTPNFMAIWNALDHECTVRCATWSNDQLLHVAYMWFHLKLSRISQFNNIMIQIIGKQVNSLPVQLVVHLLFFINVQRGAAALLMLSIEKRLLKNMHTLTLDEMSVVALGFFKSQSVMQSEELIRTIVARIELEIDTTGINELTLAPLAKLLRYSMKHSCVTMYRNLQRRLVPWVHKYQPSTLNHLAQLGVLFLVCSRELLTQITTRFAQDLRHEVRLKEITKIMYCLATFMPTHNLSHEYSLQVVEDLKSPQRQDEVFAYPASFVSLILYMAYMNVYPRDLIKICLSTNFLKRTEEVSNVDVSREVFVLDRSVEIECKDYNGEHLSESLKIELFKKFHAKSSAPANHQSKFMLDIYNHLIKILGNEKYCHVCHILPHFQQEDILLMLNRSGTFAEISADIKATTPGNIITPPSNVKWYVIVAGGRAFYQRDQHQTTGISLMKLRQLYELGYTVIEVPWFIYTNLHERQKENYLRKMIFG